MLGPSVYFFMRGFTSAAFLFSATLSLINLLINFSGSGLSIGKFKALLALLYCEISFSNALLPAGMG
jgi:hypothetical protein